jgi:hypothetical protein
MKSKNKDKNMLDEYNFSEGVRGKYSKRYAEGSNIIVLSPDVSAVFRDSISVNKALRSLMKVASAVRKTRRTA